MHFVVELLGMRPYESSADVPLFIPCHHAVMARSFHCISFDPLLFQPPGPRQKFLMQEVNMLQSLVLLPFLGRFEFA